MRSHTWQISQRTLTAHRGCGPNQTPQPKVELTHVLSFHSPLYSGCVFHFQITSVTSWNTSPHQRRLMSTPISDENTEGLRGCPLPTVMKAFTPSALQLCPQNSLCLPPSPTLSLCSNTTSSRTTCWITLSTLTPCVFPSLSFIFVNSSYAAWHGVTYFPINF